MTGTGLAHELSYAFPAPNRAQRVMQKVASSRPGAWALSRVLPSLDRGVRRVSHGRTSVPALVTGLPVLVLTTTGRRSGRRRETQLIAVPLDDTLALLGTNFGQPRTPAWVHNLEADPRVTLTYRGVTRPALARPATEDERTRVMAASRSVYAGYAAYQQRITGRTVRIFVLDPLEDRR